MLQSPFTQTDENQDRQDLGANKPDGVYCGCAHQLLERQRFMKKTLRVHVVESTINSE